jgi:Flp pilus assembly protein TadD
MVSVIVIVVIVGGVGWMLWRRRGRGRTPAALGTPAGMTPERLAFEAFTHGNTCLAAGQFAEAIAAFQRARELDPKRPHVAERLAEVARRQHDVSPPSAAAPF